MTNGRNRTFDDDDATGGVTEGTPVGVEEGVMVGTSVGGSEGAELGYIVGELVGGEIYLIGLSNISVPHTTRK
jgi:hypothetical protein